MKRHFLVLMMIGFCFANLCRASARQTSAPQNTAPTATGPKDLAEAAIKAGDAAETKPNYKKAVADFKKAIELDPNNRTAHEKFIRISFLLGFY
ncbi:MAG: hypothetical protein WCA19_27655, partial [Candidatus Acidiferrales bacterium]